MSGCSTETEASQGCGCGAAVFDGATPAYRRILALVIAINVAGFAVVAAGSVLARSASLAANTLDFAGDAATYAISLWAIGRSVQVRSNAALAKGASLAVLALLTLGYAIWRAWTGAAPEGSQISAYGAFGIAANLLAALLLVRYREGDANVRSVWLCTRNDVIQCVGVAVTGVLVMATHSRWPDLLVGAFLAAVFLRSAWQIVRQALKERAAATAPVIERNFVTHSRRATGPV